MKRGQRELKGLTPIVSSERDSTAEHFQVQASDRTTVSSDERTKAPTLPSES